MVTTPHVLTEVSNLMGRLTGRVRYGCFELFSQAIALMHEQSTPASTLRTGYAFARFGLTDTAIVDAARDPYLVLTDDLPLAAYLQGQGVDVLNFNIRPLGYR